MYTRTTDPIEGQKYLLLQMGHDGNNIFFKFYTGSKNVSSQSKMFKKLLRPKIK